MEQEPEGNGKKGGGKSEKVGEIGRNSAVLVHDWAEVNSRLLAARINGAKGGRSKALNGRVNGSSYGRAGVQHSSGGGMAAVKPQATVGGEGKGSEGMEVRGGLGSSLSFAEAGERGIEKGRAWLRAQGVPEEFISAKEKFLTSRDGINRVLGYWQERARGNSAEARRSREEWQEEKARVEGELATKGGLLTAEQAKGLQAELVMIRRQLGED